MCSKGRPDMAAISSPGGPHVLLQTVGGGGGGLHVLPRTVWGDQLKYDRPIVIAFSSISHDMQGDKV